MIHKHTNALAGETSPYLLQHAHNPVNWYPWGEEALSKAKMEDRPILLSIGYSACHWCHVMEHESFEDEEIAKVMNAHFVSIKVDREERPDLDAIYMSALQILTGSGGWPMTMFLTPDQVPFYGGTYFPPESRYGRPGFRQILLNVAQAYRENRRKIDENAKSIIDELSSSNALLIEPTKNIIGLSVLESASSGITANYDSRNGGFGQAPKFPPSMTLSFLMRSYRRTGKKELLDIVEQTLSKMAAGGIYDQLGGGFHRYSVDAYWLVPHFEKMLYDNALLSRAYLDAYLLTNNDFYRSISEETLDYVVREMTSPEGGFYSSQDADSDDIEGAYFVWTAPEIESILGEKDAELFSRYFGVTPEGNFEHGNILHIPRSAELVARLNSISEDSLSEVIRRGKQQLLGVRERRVKPGRDEKILTGWNGLMLRSFAEAAVVLDREDYRRAALQNAEFLLSTMCPGGQLLRSHKDGRSRFNAYLEDYACLIDGLLSLYEATFNLRWIDEARILADAMVRKFWDLNGWGFFFTSADHESLIHRPKELFDNATPSGNSVASHALLRLWKITGDEKWARCPISIFENLIASMQRHPSAFANLLCALDFYLGPTLEIAVVGNPGNKEESKEWMGTIFHTYLPNKVVAYGTDDGLFLLQNKPQIDGLTTAYVCENFTCGMPLTTPSDLRDRLKRR
jgi:uncharacterized protein